MVLVGIEDGGGGVSYYLFIEFKLFACSDDEKLVLPGINALV